MGVFRVESRNTDHNYEVELELNTSFKHASTLLLQQLYEDASSSIVQILTEWFAAYNDKHGRTIEVSWDAPDEHYRWTFDRQF